MSDNEKLVIPAGVQFDLSGDGVSIEYAGDILLQGEHLKPVGRVVSTGGSVQIQGNMKVGQIESQRGSVSISGDITVSSIYASNSVVLDGSIRFGSIRASGIEVIDGSIEGTLIQASENVELRGSADVANIRAPKITVRTGELTAKALESTESITLGNAKLQIDIVIAPNVQVDPETTGRVAVIESENELGPNGIRGAFRLSEFSQFTGQNADQFLSERNVGAEFARSDHFEEEEAENTQVSVPIAPTPTLEEAKLPPSRVEVYEPEPTPVSNIPTPEEEEEEEPLVESNEKASEVDEEIPAWDATPEQQEAADAVDEEIPAWSAGLAAIEVANVPDAVDEEIPAWSADLVAKDAAEEPDAVDEEIPAWSAGLAAKEVAKVPDAVDEEIPAWSAGLAARPEPIRVAVEMTEEPVAAPKPKKTLPPIASANAPAPERGQASPSKNPLHMELIGTVNNLVTCYDGKEVPPAITELQSLIDGADFSKVRAEITNIWNNLLKHHQRTGTRLQHQVTTTFNTVNTLVRKID